MNAQLLAAVGGIVVASVIVWLVTRSYYRAAYGDRYERGYSDGRAAQIRAYQDHRLTLPAWREAVRHRPPWPPEAARDAHSAGNGRLVLGASYPPADGPPRYAQLSPEQLDPEPPTSEWARDLITGIESWNAKHLTNGGPPWLD